MASNEAAKILARRPQVYTPSPPNSPIDEDMAALIREQEQAENGVATRPQMPVILRSPATRRRMQQQSLSDSEYEDEVDGDDDQLIDGELALPPVNWNLPSARVAAATGNTMNALVNHDDCILIDLTPPANSITSSSREKNLLHSEELCVLRKAMSLPPEATMNLSPHVQQRIKAITQYLENRLEEERQCTEHANAPVRQAVVQNSVWNPPSPIPAEVVEERLEEEQLCSMTNVSVGQTDVPNSMYSSPYSPDQGGVLSQCSTANGAYNNRPISFRSLIKFRTCLEVVMQNLVNEGSPLAAINEVRALLDYLNNSIEEFMTEQQQAQ